MAPHRTHILLLPPFLSPAPPPPPPERVFCPPQITSCKRLVGQVLESKQYLLTDAFDIEVTGRERESPQAGRGGMLQSLGLSRQHTMGMHLPNLSHSNHEDMTEPSLKLERSGSSKHRRSSLRPSGGINRAKTRAIETDASPVSNSSPTAVSFGATSAVEDTPKPDAAIVTQATGKAASPAAPRMPRRSILKTDHAAPQLSELQHLADAAEGSVGSSTTHSPEASKVVPRRGRASILRTSVWASKTAASLTAADGDTEKDEITTRLDITSLLKQVRNIINRHAAHCVLAALQCNPIPRVSPTLSCPCAFGMMFTPVGLIPHADTHPHGFHWRFDMPTA